MVEVQKLRLFTISAVRARPSAEIRVVEVQRLRIFTISAVRARPSAEIRVVEVQKLRTFSDFCNPRATLCGDRACRSALAAAPCEFVLVSANPLRRLCVSKRSRCGAVRGRGFDSPLVRGSSGLKIAAFKYKRSTRSVLLQLRLENRNF